MPQPYPVPYPVPRYPYWEEWYRSRPLGPYYGNKTICATNEVTGEFKPSLNCAGMQERQPKLLTSSTTSL